jgi:myo-inositol-1(or 4)-monophosphatase
LAAVVTNKIAAKLNLQPSGQSGAFILGVSWQAQERHDGSALIYTMKTLQRNKALACMSKAAAAAGRLMRDNLRAAKKINMATQHDIKLELDVRCQEVIEGQLRAAFPDIALLGEEGTHGDPDAAYRWVVDPIDGTVNFTYGIPHACVSIALQARISPRIAAGPNKASPAFETIVGVVYDPFCRELWTGIRGQAARLNGTPIRVSGRKRLEEAVVALGFAKEKRTVEEMLPMLNKLAHRVRKLRIMGAAALSLAYVATGRMDAYVEYGLRLWDIAAGGLLIECAGGEFWHEPVMGGDAYRIIANNGHLRRQLEKAGSKSSKR